MKSLADYRPKQSFGLLLIGPPKSGKTAFALQFPKPYILDCDNNLEAPVRFLRSRGADIDHVKWDSVRVSDDGKFVEDKDCWTRLTDLGKKACMDPSIETIIVDTLSFASDFLIYHILTHGGGQKIEGSTEKMLRIQDYQVFQNLMKKFITVLRASGKLVIVTAHELLEKDESTGKWIGKVQMPSSLRDNIGGMFTDVWIAEVEVKNSGADHTYRLRTKPTARHSLGNSLNLPPVIEMDFQKEIAPRLQMGEPRST